MRAVFLIKLLALVLSFYSWPVTSHTFLSSPRPRGSPAPHWGSCSAGEDCFGPCESPHAATFSPAATWRRGDVVQVTHPRLNHPGGFIRLALVPYKDSDDHMAHERGVFAFDCHESTCAADPGHPNEEGDSLCVTTVTVPDYLEDGAYTLGFVWFGGGYFYGNPLAAFPNYYSCSDVQISDGAPVVSRPEQIHPSFAAPAGGCRHWNNDPKSCANPTETFQGISERFCGLTGEKFGLPVGL